MSSLFDQELRRRQQTNYETPNTSEERAEQVEQAHAFTPWSSTGGVAAILQVWLQHPEFLYRVEVGVPVPGRPGLARGGRLRGGQGRREQAIEQLELLLRHHPDDADAAAMESTLELTLQYAKERKAFGTLVASFQNTKFTLAEVATELSRRLSYIFLRDGSGRRLPDFFDEPPLDAVRGGSSLASPRGNWLH